MLRRGAGEGLEVIPPRMDSGALVILEDLGCGDPAAARPHAAVGGGRIQAGKPWIPHCH